MIFQTPGVLTEVTMPSTGDIKWKVRIPTVGEELEYRVEWERLRKLDLPDEVPAAIALIRKVAVDWSNATDANGNPLPFDDAGLRAMNRRLLLTVALNLPDYAAFGDAPEKKSEPSPSP